MSSPFMHPITTCFPIVTCPLVSLLPMTIMFYIYWPVLFRVHSVEYLEKAQDFGRKHRKLQGRLMVMSFLSFLQLFSGWWFRIIFFRFSPLLYLGK